MSYVPLPAFAASSGARPAKIVILGEAFGATEAELRKPFVGESGKELFLMLGEAWSGTEATLHSEIRHLFKYGHAWTKRRDEWLEATGLHCTNVLAFRPPANKIEELCVSKTEVGKEYTHAPLARGKYLLPCFFPELQRLEEELTSLQPNLVIAMGNTALWALTGNTNIGTVRGTVQLGKIGNWTGKVLPTYHPAAILRSWSWRPITVADLMKARREGEFPEIRRPVRRVLVRPSLGEIEAWARRCLEDQPYLLSVDVETAAGMITDIGFARSRDDAMVVTFGNLTCPGASFWPSAQEEEQAWGWVSTLLESQIPKLLQNGVYDYQYITRMGLKPCNMLHDTMLEHHSIFPEMQKGLGFLGSVYSDEPAWKLMRKEKTDTVKRDE